MSHIQALIVVSLSALFFRCLIPHDLSPLWFCHVDHEVPSFVQRFPEEAQASFSLSIHCHVTLRINRRKSIDLVR